MTRYQSPARKMGPGSGPRACSVRDPPVRGLLAHCLLVPTKPVVRRAGVQAQDLSLLVNPERKCGHRRADEKPAKRHQRSHQPLAPTHLWARGPAPSGWHHRRAAWAGSMDRKPGERQPGRGAPAASLRTQTGPAWGQTPDIGKKWPAAPSRWRSCNKCNGICPQGRPPDLGLPKAGGRAKLTTSMEPRGPEHSCQALAQRPRVPGWGTGCQPTPLHPGGAEPAPHPAGSPWGRPCSSQHTDPCTRTDAHVKPLKRNARSAQSTWRASRPTDR